LLVRERGRRHAHDGANLSGSCRFFVATSGQEVAQQFARSLEVSSEPFLDQPTFERTVQVEHRAVFREPRARSAESRLSTLRATRSAGQPTKLSTTNMPTGR